MKFKRYGKSTILEPHRGRDAISPYILDSLAFRLVQADGTQGVMVFDTGH
jgi:hypothetical protein